MMNLGNEVTISHQDSVGFFFFLFSGGVSGASWGNGCLVRKILSYHLHHTRETYTERGATGRCVFFQNLFTPWVDILFLDIHLLFCLLTPAIDRSILLGPSLVLHRALCLPAVFCRGSGCYTFVETSRALSVPTHITTRKMIPNILFYLRALPLSLSIPSLPYECFTSVIREETIRPIRIYTNR